MNSTILLELESKLQLVASRLANNARGVELVAAGLHSAAGDLIAALQAARDALPQGFVCPIGGLPWRSGIGQGTDQLTRFAEWRNRGVGVVACWSAYREHCHDWSGLAGGPLGQLDVRGPLLTRAGSYNLQRAVEITSAATPLIWCLPLLPVALSNHRREDGTWANPEVWARCIDPARDRGIMTQAFRELGFRVARWLQTKGRDPALLTLDLGWEHSGSWFPWSCVPDRRSFQTYWRLAVDALREGLLQADPVRGDRVRIAYRIAGSTIADDTWRLEDTYPGDCWVDVVSRSAHEKDLAWASPAMWQMELAGTGPLAKRTKGGKLDGLQDALDFARSRNKPFGLTEWTVQRLPTGQHFPPSADAAGAMRAMHSWIALHNQHLDHECYLLTKETTPLGEGESWAGAVMYRQLWGRA